MHNDLNQSGSQLGEETAVSFKRILDLYTRSELRVDRNRWVYVALFLGCLSLFFAAMWYRADSRFANHVRIAFVKLDPSGSTAIEYYDEGRKPEFFATTIEAKLREWVEKRYSKRTKTIVFDYGFASVFYDANLKADFMRTAPSVANEQDACPTCPQVEAKAGPLITVDADMKPVKLGDKPFAQYTTQVFTQVATTFKAGDAPTIEHKIFTISWRFRPIEETAKRGNELQANPLGMEIFQVNERNNPTSK